MFSLRRTRWPFLGRLGTQRVAWAGVQGASNGPNDVERHDVGDGSWSHPYRDRADFGRRSPH